MDNSICHYRKGFNDGVKSVVDKFNDVVAESKINEPYKFMSTIKDVMNNFLYSVEDNDIESDVVEIVLGIPSDVWLDILAQSEDTGLTVDFLVRFYLSMSKSEYEDLSKSYRETVLGKSKEIALLKKRLEMYE